MIRLEGFHKHCITLEAGEGVAAGQLVTVTDDDTAATATSGGFAGLALAVRNGKVLVQVTGYMKVPMASAELTKAAYGYGQIAAAAGGKTWSFFQMSMVPLVMAGEKGRNFSPW